MLQNHYTNLSIPFTAIVSFLDTLNLQCLCDSVPICTLLYLLLLLISFPKVLFTLQYVSEKMEALTITFLNFCMDFNSCVVVLKLYILHRATLSMDRIFGLRLLLLVKKKDAWKRKFIQKSQLGFSSLVIRLMMMVTSVEHWTQKE